VSGKRANRKSNHFFRSFVCQSPQVSGGSFFHTMAIL
jgi:hypothetical protein